VTQKDVVISTAEAFFPFGRGFFSLRTGFDALSSWRNPFGRGFFPFGTGFFPLWTGFASLETPEKPFGTGFYLLRGSFFEV
jgi:hypothetical protein